MIQYLKRCVSLPTQTNGESALLFLAICTSGLYGLLCNDYLSRQAMLQEEVLPGDAVKHCP